MGIKNRSVMTYIMAAWFISEMIMFSVITLLVHLYIAQSVELDIRSSLSRQVTSLSEVIVKDSNGFRVDENRIEKKYPDMFIAVLDGTGTVLWGSVPDGVPVTIKKSMAPARADAGTISYYYIDRNIKYTMSDNVFVRAYVSEKDILSDYIPMRIYSYGGVVLIFMLFTAGMLHALKRFRRSIKTMEASVEKIGTARQADAHMNTDGHYKEISSLIEANNRMIDRMNELFAQQEQFSSDVAHELRTPISVIKAQSQSALHNPQLSAEEQQSFSVILKQAHKMQTLVVTLLELSRLESGERENMQECIDLAEIVSAVCEAEQDRQSESSGIRFQVTNHEAAETSGSISLVTIAVTNLISNAVKFSTNDSVIEAETGEREGFVFVSVKDNGIGMTEEEQEKVLTRFYQSDTSRSGSGYGLGIPIALKIARLHGGTLEIESKPQQGSCFTLFLAKNG